MLGDEDTIEKLREKIDDYLRFGVRMVWIADPRTRSVMVVPSDGERETVLSEDERIDGGDVLPGLSLRVARFFEVE